MEGCKERVCMGCEQRSANGGVRREGCAWKGITEK